MILRSFILLFMISFVNIESSSASKRIDYNSYIYPQMNMSPTQDWFEWWYTKLVDPKTGRGFYFTYGLVNPGKQQDPNGNSRASVSFGDFTNKIQIEKVLPVSSFQGSTDRYEIGMQHFTSLESTSAYASSEELNARFVHEGKTVSWNLRFKESWGYNVMGWAMWIPKLLNIYWYPVQGSVKVSGTIKNGDDIIELENAPAYQDRNWGAEFPYWWTWIVANQFRGENPAEETVLVAGGGAPSVLGRRSPYEGVSLGLRYQGHVYSFRPVDGVFPKADIKFGKWEVQSRNLKGEEIEISAHAPAEEFMDLQFMAPNGKVFHDYETLNGKLRVVLKRPGKKPVTLLSDYAGIEYGSYDTFPSNIFSPNRKHH